MTETEIQSIGARKLSLVLNAVFAQQARDVAGKVTIGDNVPDLTYWVRATAETVKPLLLQMAQIGMLQAQRQIGSKVRGTSSSDLRRHTVGNEAAFVGKGLVTKAAPKITSSFDLFNPKVLDAVDAAAFAFCRETMETAVGRLSEVLEKLRAALKAGLSRGDAIKALAAKVREIFASPERAFRIAVTESSRAINGGQLLAAKESGVAKSKTWLASADACARCLELDGKNVPLNAPFYVDSKGGPYATVMHPPLHPYCMCTFTEEL